MIELREWQKKAHQKWIEHDKMGIVSVVTGGGKTIFAISLIMALNEELKSNIKFLIIVPTTQLKDQWTVEIQRFTTLEVNNKIGFENKLTICTNIHAQKNSNLIDHESTMIVLDECHRYGTIKNSAFLNKKYYATIGLTATLERLYDNGVEQILIPYIGNIIYRYSLQDAVNDGVVVPYKCFNIKIPLTNEDEKKISKLNRSISIANEKGEEEKVKNLLLQRKRIHNNTPYRTAIGIKIITENILTKKIVFCEEIQQATYIHLHLKENLKLETAIYHSNLSFEKRISYLKGFITNQYHTMITVKGLDEGFDAPDIKMAIIISASNTNRQRIQRLGRSLRLAPNKTHAKIYTLYSSESEKKVLINNEIKSKTEYETKWEQYTLK